MHPTRGFDIAPNREAVHHLPETSYKVHSNALGCFDREWEEVPSDYIYFAGDSFTWGFTPYGERFSDLFEKSSGRPSVKCGVSSTSSRHQIEKFLEVTERIGHGPSQVVLSFFANDVQEDYLFPHSSVADGWLVPARFFDKESQPISVDRKWINEQLETALNTQQAEESCADSVSVFAKCFSLSANLSIRLIRQIFPKHRSDVSVYEEGLNYRGSKIYKNPPTETGAVDNRLFRYKDYEIALPNQKSLKTWLGHADKSNYRLLILLVPPPSVVDGDEAYYKEVHDFLTSAGADFVDLQEKFRERDLGRPDLYWRYDGHFSPAGHAIVADILQKELSARD